MKYIIDVSDEAIELMGGHINIFVEPVFKTGDCKHYALRISKEDIEPYTEPNCKAIDLQYAHDIENVAKMNYSEGAKDAWDFARAVNDMGYDDFVSCFDGKTEEMVYELSYSEVKAEYEAWKKQKDEIRVGDEVYDHTISGTGIVTNVVNKNMVDIMWDDGSVNDSVSVKDLRKTGRHFDEVEELLKKMKKQ